MTNHLDMNRLSVDVLILGSGMAGMTAAAQAAQDGLSVLVVERAPTPGGSAGISHGYVWTTPTLEALQAEDPAVDPVLVSILADGFLPAVDWMRDLGVEVGERIMGIYRFGHGFQIDIHDYLNRCRAAVEGAGGWLVTGVTTRRLVLDDAGRVVGAEMSDADGDPIEVSARETILATGGFQGASDLRAGRISPAAEDILLRSNAYSAGDGLRLAEAAGAEFVDGGRGFYGHLVPSPLVSLDPPDFVTIAMLHSGYCLLFNRAGERFTDESLGDHENNQAVLEQAGSRALLVADDRVRRERIMTPYIPGMAGVDKFALAEERGARVHSAATLSDLVTAVGAWGFDPVSLGGSLNDYNRTARDAPELLSPPSTRHCRPLDVPPFFAMEVQPAITFSYGGIRVDESGRVVGREGPIEGLLAAGVDIGGVYTRAYAGGLARGLVFGRLAARTAAARLTNKEA